ncbi:hypothetical protein KAW50_07045 [candidate division WOR-3 bacterium]|nr:hypothetical protein [candidate division WOR-3 bacterium]
MLLVTVIRKILLLIFAILLPHISVACEIRIQPPTRFDTTEYIFIGEVIDIVGPLESERVKGEAYGFLVKVKQTVFLPDSSTNYFEVYDYGITPSCSPEGIPKDFLSDSKGCEVRVIGKESEFFASRLEAGKIRLDAWLINRGNQGSITRNFNNITSATSVFNYKKDSEAGRELLYFEARKDLLRLKNASSDEEKIKILRRLMEFRTYFKWFSEVLKAHISNEKTIQMLNQEFLKLRESNK